MKTMSVIVFCLLAFTLAAQTNLPAFYHTYPEIIDQLNAWQTQYPDLVKVEIIGYTSGAPYQEPIPVYAIKLSGNAQEQEDEPRLLFVGQCHAEEVIGVEITMNNIKTILDNQFQYPISAWLASLELWFVPTMNPEGLSVVMELDDPSYRKTVRDNDGNGIFNYEAGLGNDFDGVDPNRNYDFSWIHGDSLGSSEHTEVNDYYRGPYPFSEGGNLAIKNLADREHFIYSINWHSSRQGGLSESTYYPWEFAGSANRRNPDYGIAQQIGTGVGSSIQNQAGTSTYLASASKGRYGASTVWFYAEYGTIQLTIETAGIQPDSTQLADTVEKCSNGVYWMINRALNFLPDSSALTGHVYDAATGQALEAEVIIRERVSPYFKPRLTEPVFGRFWRPLLPGTYTLMVRKKGYQTVSQTVTLNADQWTLRNVSLSPVVEGVYTGTVTCNGNPVDAVIRIDGFGAAADSILAENGAFSIHADPGTYAITVTAPGCFPYTGTLEVSSGPHGLVYELTPATVLFSEDWETGSDGWTLDDPWELTNLISHSGYAMTDSIGGAGFHALNCDISVTTVNPVDLGDAAHVMLTFYQNIYTEWDFVPCRVEVSTDQQTWNEVYRISGKHDTWLPALVNLDAYSGQEVYLRFRLTSDVPDKDLTDPGWTIDDIRIITGDASATGIDDPGQVPAVNTLRQNFPNPFNPETTISFVLNAPAGIPAEIRVFNIRGQQIERLPLGETERLRGNVVWNGRNQSSGVYFYQLVVGDRTVETRKACLIK